MLNLLGVQSLCAAETMGEKVELVVSFRVVIREIGRLGMTTHLADNRN